MAEVSIPEEVLQMPIRVSFNMLTGEMAVEGCDKNPVVALGMLDYALARVRRFLATSDILAEAKSAPRVQVVPRLVT
jgi:hypothetical protein